MQDQIDAIEGQVKAALAVLAMLPQVNLKCIERAKSLIVKSKSLEELSINSTPQPNAHAMIALRRLEALVNLRG